MDGVNALNLFEALLIIAAILAHTAIRFISPFHASNHVDLDSSDDDSAPILSTPSSDDFVNIKYDVFLSFRGKDTRDNFTDHLRAALENSRIQTFMDDKIRKGEGLSPVLIRAIENSKIYVIVFSKHYASSPWCLEEVTKIMECKNRYKREVIPIFYNVEPFHVRRQKGSYEDAFIKHNHRFMNKKDKVRMWKDALTQAANFNGWDSRNIRSEAKLVKEIVKVVLNKLKGISPSYLEGQVGINDRVKEIKGIISYLPIVGIWGMGGIGKTTLATAVFHELKPQFDSYSFVNVREELVRIGLDQLMKKELVRIGLDQLMKKCLEELLEDDGIDTYSIGSNFVKRRLQCRKVLLVLDNVDNFILIEDLRKLLDLFGQGSSTIITSRDKQVFRIIGVEPYHVQAMNPNDALHLFNLKAFKQKKPPKDYMLLSQSVLSYCQGIPLALTVLGCFLHRRTEEDWESALENLKQAPHEVIFNVLKLSFDTLNDKQKKMFLDIACLTRIRIMLYEADIQSCYDFSTKIEFNVLKDRSLVSVDAHSRVVMHDLVVDMGLEVAYQQLNNEPKKPIRLWRHEDIYRVLRRNNKVIEKIRVISLDMCKIKEIDLKEDDFQKLYNLIILKFYKSDPKKPSKVNIFEGFISFLSEELRIIYWEDYPLPNMPLGFCANNLVRLNMPNSNLKRLWDGDQHFPNLKVIDLWGSKFLTELPDLSQAPHIKDIWLTDCVNLLQINSSKPLVKLEVLCLHRCKKLDSAEILTFCNQLSHLYWIQCPLKSLPLSCLRNLVCLKMPKSKLEHLWDGKQYFPQLEEIDLARSKYLTRMPDLSQAPNIRKIDLTSCISLHQLYSSNSLSNLNTLLLNDCNKLKVEKFCDRYQWRIAQPEMRELLICDFFFSGRMNCYRVSLPPISDAVPELLSVPR